MNIRPHTYLSERFIALDIMKTMAIFLMILGHVVIMYGSPQAIASDLTTWLAFTTEGMGAPAFVFAMGASIILSSRKSPKSVVLRGILLFVIGYILNLLKFYPTIVLLNIFPQELFTETGRMNDTDGLISFLMVADILQFAAIAYVICAFLQPLVNKFRPLGLLLSIPFFLLAPSLYDSDSTSSSYLLQLVYGKNDQVYFPLFPWLGFALLGLSVGSWVRSMGSNPRKLWIILVLTGLVFAAIGLLLMALNQELYFGTDYYHRGIGGLLMYFGELLVFLTIFHMLTPLLSTWLRTFFVFCSRNVTRIYILQWVLIYWCWAFIPYGTQPWSRIWRYFLLFTFLTLSLASIWEYLLRLGTTAKNPVTNEKISIDTKT